MSPSSARSFSSSKTWETSPVSRRVVMWPPSQVAIPADSWPRCWRAYRPKYASRATSCPGAYTPKTPHSSRGPSRSGMGQSVASIHVPGREIRKRGRLQRKASSGPGPRRPRDHAVCGELFGQRWSKSGAYIAGSDHRELSASEGAPSGLGLRQVDPGFRLGRHELDPVAADIPDPQNRDALALSLSFEVAQNLFRPGHDEPARPLSKERGLAGGAA